MIATVGFDSSTWNELPWKFEARTSAIAVIEAQRAAIVRMRNEGLISFEVMRRVERHLDLEESRPES